MKLAEALSLRADLQKRVAQLKQRLKDNVKIEQGDSTIENPESLFAELDRSLVKLEELIYRINSTNIHTQHNGKSLTQLIAQKDTLTLRIATLREIYKHITDRDRYGLNEIKYVRTIDVEKLNQQIDSYSHQYRKLDLEIQSVNWTTDLE